MTRIIQASGPVPTRIDRFRGQWSFLSNFQLCPITYEDDAYASVEHAFQAAKLVDRKERRLFQVPSTPSQAKMMGRGVSIRPGWDSLRERVMEELLRDKFYNFPYNEALMNTGESYLVEGNDWHDTFWGICDGTCPRGPHAEEGLNKLGDLLMKIRAELIQRRRMYEHLDAS